MARMDPPVRNHLTAAVEVIRPSTYAATATANSNADLWTYYENLPDVRYIVNLEGRLLSLSSPRLEKLDSDGLWQNATNVPPAAGGALQALHDSPGGLEDIQARFAQQMGVTGCSFLTGYDRGGQLQVEALSSSELQSDGKNWFRVAGAVYRTGVVSDAASGFPSKPKVSRVWRRHPQWSARAESALQALKGDMDTLILLNQALRARVRSRLAAAGLLFIPNSLVVAEVGDRPDGSLKADDLVTDVLIRAMAAGIADPESPDASMPIIVRGPDGIGQLIKHITLDRMIDESEMALRRELRENILQGMDAPKEIAGSNDRTPPANHFNEASIKMEMWHHNAAPVGDVLWEALTRMVLTPWLEKRGVDGTYRWRVDRDSVQIRNNDDEKTRAAIDRHLLSENAARRRLGIDRNDGPTDIERIRMIGLELGIPELALYKIDVDGIDLSNLKSVKSGARKTGNGRDIPAETPSDTPIQGDPRVR